LPGNGAEPPPVEDEGYESKFDANGDAVMGVGPTKTNPTCLDSEDDASQHSSGSEFWRQMTAALDRNKAAQVFIKLRSCWGSIHKLYKIGKTNEFTLGLREF
jgi:hypothetical protein